MKPVVVIFGTILLGLSTVAVADNQWSSRNRLAWFGGLGSASLDSQAAAEEGIEDSALYIRLGVEFQRSHILYGVGLSGLFYDDNAEFSQTVEDLFGDVSTEDSTAEAFDLFGEVGYRYMLSAGSYMDFFGGYEHVLSSERSISNCSNCFEEDIDIESGVYLMPRYQYETEGGYLFTLLYRQYVSGDMENAIALTIGFAR